MLHIHDAVGNHVRAIRDGLTRRGVPSLIFVENDDPDTADSTRAASTYDQVATPGDLLVYHHATASSLVSWLADRRARVAVVYHNVTPPEYFVGWEDHIADIQRRAHRELAELAGFAEAGIADSEFNRRDLTGAGFEKTWVRPPVFGGRWAPFPTSVEEGVEPDGIAGGCRWLCVGRLAPNKAVERVIAGLAAFRRCHDPTATLNVVGRDAVLPYGAALRGFVSDLGLDDAVTFIGHIDDQGLRRLYRSSDVLVLGSEHEGFCVPLVEAMEAGLPVAAFASGAVPEVLGDAGILYSEPGPVAVSDAACQALAERSSLRTRAQEQLAVLGLADAEQSYCRLLLQLLRNSPR